MKKVILLALAMTSLTMQAEEKNTDSLDLDAKHYKENSSVQYKLAEDVFELHAFRSDEVILDVGCGDGKITKRLAEKVPQGSVEGVDPSLAMITCAKEVYPQDEFPNLKFSMGAAETFQADKKYDLITAFCSLHWVHGQEAALRHMTEALKENGKLLILTFPKCSPYYSVLEEVIYSPKWAAYADAAVCKHWVPAEKYPEIAQELGLRELYLETLSEVAFYKDKQDFKDYVKGWLPCLISIPEELQEAFLEDIAVNAQQQYGTEGEPGFGLPYNKIVMYWEKA